MEITKKQHSIISGSGLIVYLLYIVASFWIKEYWFIRLGMALTTIIIIYFMWGFRFNKIIILMVLAFMSSSIIFYHEIRAFLI